MMIDPVELAAEKADLVRAIRHMQGVLRTRQAMTDEEQKAPTIPAPPPVKTCSCGCSYDAAEWAALRHVGVMDDGVDVLELRDCANCHSTIAISIGDSQ